MGRNAGGTRPLPRWWGIAAVVLGAACLLGALALAAAPGETPWRDQRTVTRSAILGVALCVSGVLALARARGSVPSVERPPAPAGVTGARPAPSGAVGLEGMLKHSDDVLATLRDLVSHARRGEGLDDVLELLSRSGVMEWEGAPVVRANRLGRNGRWWLSTPGVGLERADLERLVGIEAALNVGEDLARAGGGPGGLDDRVEEALVGVAGLRPLADRSRAFRDDLLQGAEKDGEWSCRLRFADGAEDLPAPFRVEQSFQSNVGAGLACVDVCAPSPACFAWAGGTARTRADLASRHALGLALALGRVALESSRLVRRVVVNCHDRDDERTTLLSLDLTREALERLSHASPRSLPSDEALAARVGEDGWLLPVEPFLRADSPEVCPPERGRAVELDDTECGGALASACGARRVSDLGIMEKAGREQAWRKIEASLRGTTREAVSALVELRGSTDDLTVAEACGRVAEALVTGGADVSDHETLERLFVDGGPLADACRRASKALDGEPVREELEQALAELERALAPAEETGIYLDDADSVYRYFCSTIERVAYNLSADDGGRAVRLVPDEYYGAHLYSTRILNQLGRHDEALRHADELVRVAPACADTALSRVRCLEEQSRVFEAADALVGAIREAVTPREVSICFYRLAYMEWKLGRSDLAVACYQRSMAHDDEIAQAASAELDDLLESEEGLERLSDERVAPTLEAAGIPSADLERRRRQTALAAAACTDAGLFSVARPLVAALLTHKNDDALVDVRNSLVTR